VEPAAGASPPANVRSTRSRHLRRLIAGRPVAYVLTCGAAASALGGAYLHRPAIMLAGPVVLALVVLAASFAFARRNAAEDFFRGFAQGHDFEYLGQMELLPLTPLLGAGDRRRCQHYMEGQVGDEPLRCGLGHYVYEELHRTRDADHGGHGWEPHDFTVCVFDLEPGIRLFPGVFLTRRRHLIAAITAEHWLSRHGRHEVELESIELANRYELLVDDSQDRIALRRLFTPSFVVFLATHPLRPCFEYRGGTLVVYLERRLQDAGSLNLMLEAAAEIGTRFSREIEEQSPPAAYLENSTPIRTRSRLGVGSGLQPEK
jgi:hypothetical protein